MDKKKYGVEERRLLEGRSGMGLGPLVNLITGYTKELKKNFEIEKKKILKKKI